jgi:hypothetical protein
MKCSKPTNATKNSRKSGHAVLHRKYPLMTQSGRGLVHCKCPLRTQSGHEHGTYLHNHENGTSVGPLVNLHALGATIFNRSTDKSDSHSNL